MISEVDTNPFREALRELYLTCCERRCWDPTRSVSRFEVDGELATGSIAKVLTGERHVIDMVSIDRMLDGLYNEGDGVLSVEELPTWREELHVARAVQMEKIHFLKQVNPRLDSLPIDLMEELWQWTRERYRRLAGEGRWAIDGGGLALPMLGSRHWPEHVHKDSFKWTAPYRLPLIFSKTAPAQETDYGSGHSGSFRTHQPQTLVAEGVPALQDFIISVDVLLKVDDPSIRSPQAIPLLFALVLYHKIGRTPFENGRFDFFSIGQLDGTPVVGSGHHLIGESERVLGTRQEKINWKEDHRVTPGIRQNLMLVRNESHTSFSVDGQEVERKRRRNRKWTKVGIEFYSGHMRGSYVEIIDLTVINISNVIFSYDESTGATSWHDRMGRILGMHTRSRSLGPNNQS